VVVAEHQAAGGIAAEMAELLANGHACRLERLVARAPLGNMPPEGFGVPVLGDGEEPGLAVPDGGNLRGVGRPHHVRRLGNDPAVVRLELARPRTVRRQQGVLAHHPQDPLARHADVIAHAQARPDLAMSFARPGRACEVVPDGGEQIGVGDHRLRPAPCRRDRRIPRRVGTGRVEARPRHAPDAADARDAVASPGGGRDRLGHHRRLLRAKGPGARSIFARRSSFSMLNSPIR
jgi:hypothetical protein